MTYVYAFIRIPHAKVTEAYFTLLSGKLALVLGRFGQKIEAVLGKKRGLFWVKNGERL